MLSEKLNVCGNRIDYLSRRGNDEKRNEEETRRLNSFFAAFATVSKLIDILVVSRALKDLGPYVLSMKEEDGIKKMASMYYECLKNENVDNFISRYCSSSTFLAETLNRIKGSWAFIVECNTKELLENITLVKLFEDGPSGRRLIADSEKLINLLKDSPSAANIAAYREALRVGETVSNGQKGDPEILDFLKKAQHGKATFADVTPKIYEWIQKNGRGHILHLKIE